MTDDAATRTHPSYGTCGGCQQLKHVTAEGLLRDHNRFEATGTVVSPSRRGVLRIPLLTKVLSVSSVTATAVTPVLCSCVSTSPIARRLVLASACASA